MYDVTFKCAPECNCICEDGGIISKMRKIYELPKSACHMIWRALLDYNECNKNGTDYNEKRRRCKWKQNNILLQEDSNELQIMSDVMESGHVLI